MKMNILVLLVLVYSGLARGAAIPSENAKQGVMPSATSTELLAKKLVEGLSSSSTDAPDLFFPEAPFIQLKDLKNATSYYRDQLIPSYKSDYAKLKAKLKPQGALSFEGFKFGYCKWKAVGSEYNKIPYWSCYRSVIHAKDAKGVKVSIGIKTLINWGRDWFITHLGS